MPRTHLFVIQEVLFDNGNGGEDFGVLVAPVHLEVFDARPRLAMDEDYQTNSICAILGHGRQ